MADNDYGKESWTAFERFVRYESYPEGAEETLDHQWALLPQDFRSNVVPAHIRFHEAQQKLVRAGNALPKCVPIDMYSQLRRDVLAELVDSMATPTERHEALITVRDAYEEVKIALADLMNARREYRYLDCISPASFDTLQKHSEWLEDQTNVAEHEIGRLQLRLPQYHRAEEARKNEIRALGLPLGPGWTGTWLLGQGGFGVANLWIRQNCDGEIVDRIVVKDCKVDRRTHEDETAWALQDGVYVPLEVYAQQLLGGKEGSETLVRVRGWREKAGRPRSNFRMLMEFCPHGDLFDLRMRTYGEEDKEGSQLPGPFLWHVFDCLATAGVLMRQGSFDGQMLETWRTVVHSDIKLANVLLGPPDADQFRGYPTPKLGDFGLAILLSSSADVSSRGGTISNEPPENKRWYIDKTGAIDISPPLNTRSDVWAVGNIIYSLMIAAEGDAEMNFSKPHSPKEPDLDALRGRFSRSLLDLVRRCMRYHPEDRIGFVELSAAIKDTISKGVGGEFGRLRIMSKAPAHHPIWQDPSFKLIVNQDLWPMYAGLAQCKPRDGGKRAPPPPWSQWSVSNELDYKGPVQADTPTIRRRPGGVPVHRGPLFGPQGRSGPSPRRIGSPQQPPRRTFRVANPDPVRTSRSARAGAGERVAKTPQRGYRVPDSDDDDDADDEDDEDEDDERKDGDDDYQDSSEECDMDMTE